MVEIFSLNQLFTLREKLNIIDVRSPIEFKQGHIPGSSNIPLFADEERAQIGLIYKTEGVEEAVKLGESYANPKIEEYFSKLKAISAGKEFIVLCSRGGMRSQRFSQLLDEKGYRVFRLEEGYKSYRHFVQKSLSEKYSLLILGGKTGSGKTEILVELENSNEQVLNLEKMANHRGSAFGSIGMGSQPTTEQFENILYEKIRTFDLRRRIWVEDESINIGRVYLPKEFYELMKLSPLIILEMDKHFRVDRLCKDYSMDGLIPLKEGIKKIEKRLGHERVRESFKALDNGDISRAASIILEYYDKCYTYGVTKKTNIQIDHFKTENGDSRDIAKKLLNQFPFY